MPEEWAWCRFGNFIDVRDGTHYSPKYVENGYPFVTSKNLVNGKIDFTDVKYISEKDHKEFIQRSYVEDGDILFAMIGSIGNPVLVKKDREFSIKNVALFKPYSKQLTNMNYLFYFLLWIQENLRTKAKGGMQPFIPLSFFRTEVFIPIPPIEEQKRIVSEINLIFNQIEQIEQNKIDLQSLIKQTKSKILSLAIHGKLVSQDPTDEPASVLLEKIRAEKEEKISKGELKREKKDSYIYKGSDNFYYEKFADGTIKDIEDEIPFDVPEGWVWCRIKYLALDMADGPFGSNLKTEHYTAKKEVRLIQLSNIGEYGWREENTKYTTFEHAKNNIARSIVEPGNIVIAKMMPAGRAIICPNIEKMYVLSSDAIKLVPTSFINIQFLLNVINSPSFRNSVTDNVQGSTRLRTSISKLKECLFPLPPLDEQNRIVEKIEELIATLDNIQENII